MDRRDTLKLWTALLGASWWLGCAPEASDDAPQPTAPRANTPLARALAVARENGKPLLVFVAPEPPMTSSRLALDVAEAFEAGGRDLLLDLALCELACASPSQLASQLSIEAQPGEVGWIEPNGGRNSWSRIAMCPPSPLDAVEDGCNEPKQRGAYNAAQLRAALAGSQEILAQRERDARHALPAAWVETFVARLDAGAAVSDDSLVSGAAILRRHAAARAYEATVLQFVGARVLVRPPAGSRWGKYDGCAHSDVAFLESDSLELQNELSNRYFDSQYRLRGEEPPPHSSDAARLAALMVLCGMAYGSESSNAFLVFYTDEP